MEALMAKKKKCIKCCMVIVLLEHREANDLLLKELESSYIKP